MARSRVPVRHVLDISAMAVPFGMFLGRVANFINGELLGAVVSRPGEPAPWWAVRYPQELSDEYMLRVKPEHLPVHTGAEWEAVLSILDRFGRGERGFDFAYHRMLERLQGGDGALARELAPLISARHPSQLYQAAAEGVVLGAVLWWVARRPRLPGVIGSWFMITYGVLRIVTEIWRLPDTHLAVQRWMGLSRGQWLSVAMIVVGIGALVWIRRVGGEKMGGWLECLRERRKAKL